MKRRRKAAILEVLILVFVVFIVNISSMGRILEGIDHEMVYHIFRDS
jgi:hypothetical protein